MNFKIQISKKSKCNDKILLVKKESDLKALLNNDKTEKKIKSLLSDSNKVVHFFDGENLTVVVKTDKDLEVNRNNANACFKVLGQFQVKEIAIESVCDEDTNYSFVEGLLLSTYTFNKYKSEAKENILKVELAEGVLSKSALTFLEVNVEANEIAKDLVNEPLRSYLQWTDAN